MNRNDPITAFAYETAKQIEKTVNDRTNNLNDKNKVLEGKIRGFYIRLKYKKFISMPDLIEEYKNLFQIETDIHGYLK